MRKFVGFGLVAVLSVPAAARAQDFGVAIHGGTLGVGADVAVSVMPQANLRGGVSFMPFDLGLTASDIQYNLALASPQFTVMLDIMAISGLRFSGGLVYTSQNIEAVGDFVGQVDIGGTMYGSSEIGRLTGTVITRDLSPYLGLGWGNVARSRIGFFMDMGVAFQGAPAVALSADGSMASQPLFQSSLDAERQAIEDDLSFFTVYPVVSLGFSVGF